MWSTSCAKCARRGRWSCSCRPASLVTLTNYPAEGWWSLPVPWPTTDDGCDAKVSCNQVPAMRTGQR